MIDVQLGEMRRQGRLRDVEVLRQLAGRHVPVAQQLEDPAARWMAEHVEDVQQ
jgi:hypothetical protein